MLNVRVFPPPSIPLNVTDRTDCDGKLVFLGYNVCGNFSYPVAESSSLNDLRDWADDYGYDGILIRWANIPNVPEAKVV